MMTQEELREALLEALLDYETLKKKRRLKTVKKALQGTMVATVIGSTGIIAGCQGGRTNQQAKETATMIASSLNGLSADADNTQGSNYVKPVPAIAHFGFDSHVLAPDQEERLIELVSHLPKDAEISVIGRTDTHGKKSYNQRLGMLRAQAVADFFAKNGIKIKTIGSKISEDVTHSWMARRVDILVDSGSKPFFLNIAPDSQTASASQLKPQTSLSASAHLSDELAVPSHVASTKDSTVTQLPQTTSKTVDNIAKSTISDPGVDRQQVRGVTHFSSGSHSLASAHRERLLELIKQLPNDAQLTVVGRTDAIGDTHTNEKLGMLRAKTVASFLASHGIQVKAVGSKPSSNGTSGWMARRVDIVVESDSAPVRITLPRPHIQEPTTRMVKATPKVQHTVTHTAAVKEKKVAPEKSLATIRDKSSIAIESETNRLIQRARDVHNVRQTEQTFGETPGWWDNRTKVNSTCLDKAVSARDTLNCFPK